MNDAIATNLTDLMVAEVTKQTNGPAVQLLIAKKVEETIETAVTNAFRSFGDVNKQITHIITDSLKIADRMDIPSYGTMVMALLRTKLDERLHSLITERLDAEMNEILSIAPKELKFSELVQAIVDHASEDMRNRYGTSITCIVEENERYGGHEIWLDKDENVEKRECEIRITVSKDGAVLSINVDKKDPKITVRMGPMWGYQKMIYGAYCCGSKIIMDDLYPPTGIGDF